ncbi:Uma2 family endonuclease [Candidatus Bipolaricaulota bacterium]|nr:Uma2 family endonuclease [Candidatus Bipolaricaulota bacterium]
MKAKAPAKKMTYQEFLAWCDEDTWAEWVDGEVIVLSPASNRHQDLCNFLAFLLRAYAEARGLGVIRTAPFSMHLLELKRAREPDILFIAAENLNRLKETHLEGPADLVVEIVSPESRLRDRGEKFAEYELAGVREYWIIDPDERRADFYVLGSDGRYERRRPDEAGIYRSEVIPGFWLQVGWLWREPLPPVLEVLKELNLI